MIDNRCIGRYGEPFTVGIPYSSERKRMQRLEQCHLGKALILFFKIAQAFMWLKKCEQESLPHGACAGRPCTDSIDRGIEIVESDMSLFKLATSDQLFRNGSNFVRSEEHTSELQSRPH